MTENNVTIIKPNEVVEKCGNCIFFHPVKQSKLLNAPKVGFCRRFPPAVNAVLVPGQQAQPGQVEMGVMPFSNNPQLTPDWWCGEWSPDEDTQAIMDRPPSDDIPY